MRRDYAAPIMDRESNVAAVQANKSVVMQPLNKIV